MSEIPVSLVVSEVVQPAAIGKKILLTTARVVREQFPQIGSRLCNSSVETEDAALFELEDLLSAPDLIPAAPTVSERLEEASADYALLM